MRAAGVGVTSCCGDAESGVQWHRITPSGFQAALSTPSWLMPCSLLTHDTCTLSQIIVMLSGLLPHPEMTMSMMGITFNVHALCFFAAHGLSGAASTRVGNELGKRSWLLHAGTKGADVPSGELTVKPVCRLLCMCAVAPRRNG